MTGGSVAVNGGRELQDAVVALGERLGLEAAVEVKVGRRVWGAKRHIDVVLSHPASRLRLGIECKFQKDAGTAEEKIAATIEDIKAWPIKGIIVIAGPGFSENMRGYLLSSGIVLDFEDLEDWLKLFFAL